MYVYIIMSLFRKLCRKNMFYYMNCLWLQVNKDYIGEWHFMCIKISLIFTPASENVNVPLFWRSFTLYNALNIFFKQISWNYLFLCKLSFSASNSIISIWTTKCTIYTSKMWSRIRGGRRYTLLWHQRWIELK